MGGGKECSECEESVGPIPRPRWYSARRTAPSKDSHWLSLSEPGWVLIPSPHPKCQRPREGAVCIWSG